MGEKELDFSHNIDCFIEHLGAEILPYTTMLSVIFFGVGVIHSSTKDLLHSNPS